MRFARTIVATLSIGLLILGYVAVREARENERLSQLVPLTVYRESDIERRAISEFSKIRGESETSIRSRRIPILVELKDMDCVSLELKQDYLGSSEAICFQKGNGPVLKTYSSGE